MAPPYGGLTPDACCHLSAMQRNVVHRLAPAVLRLDADATAPAGQVTGGQAVVVLAPVSVCRRRALSIFSAGVAEMTALSCAWSMEWQSKLQGTC